jgi:hypothetical protein
MDMYRRRRMTIKISLCVLPLVGIFVWMIIREIQGQLTSGGFLGVLVLLLIALGLMVRLLAPGSRVAQDIACLCRILAVVCAVMCAVVTCL